MQEKEAIKKIDKPDMRRCMYCGAKVEYPESNNPTDYLHDIRDKYSDGNGDEEGQVTCSYCNQITMLNRAFYLMIDNPEEIRWRITDIKDIVTDMENNKDKMFQYYAEHKSDHEALKIKKREQERIKPPDTLGKLP